MFALAALKQLVPLGQSAGQWLRHRLVEAMPQIVERSMALDDAAISSGVADGRILFRANDPGGVISCRSSRPWLEGGCAGGLNECRNQ